MRRKNLIIGLLTTIALVFVSTVVIATGSVTDRVGLSGNSELQTYTFFTATTTTATSTNLSAGGGYFGIIGAKKLTFYFSRGDTTGQGNAGSSQFLVQVSPDRTNWYDWNMLIQNSATTTADVTIPSSITISAATSTTVVGVPLKDFSFSAVRCVVRETTDGEHTCKATAEF